MKKKISLLLILALLLVTLAGCSSGNEPSGDVAKDSLTVRLTINPTNLDPHNHNNAAGFTLDPQVFDPLVIMDDSTMEIVPCLAESWEMSSDGLEYTFHLKQGVKFHNGNDFTASDVKYSYERVLNGTYLNGVINMIKEIVVDDDYTVTMKLDAPFAAFLNQVQQIYIVDEDTINEQGDDCLKNPIGTGPYKFVEWNETEQTITYEANQEYFGKAASIDNLIFKVITDINTAAIALESGDIDVATKIDSNAYYSLKDNDNIVIDSAPTSYMFYVIFNNDNGLTTNKLFRQAVSYAIDRDAIVMVNSDGLDTVTKGYAYEGISGYSGGVEMYEYNPEKAKELLAESGIENPEVSFIADREYVVKIAEIIQGQLEEVGIKVNVEQIDAAAYDEQIYGKTFQMGYWTNSNYSMDADDLYKWYYSTSGSNITYFNNSEFDSLILEARQENDNAKREELYAEALEIMKEEAPIVPIYFQTQLDAYQKGLVTPGIRAAGYPRYSNYSWE